MRDGSYPLIQPSDVPLGYAFRIPGHGHTNKFGITPVFDCHPEPESQATPCRNDVLRNRPDTA